MTPKRSAAELKAERERVNRLLMKVEVYLNYKLHAQATTALNELFALAPENIDAHTWQLRLFEMTGRKQMAARQLVKLASLVVDDPERANEFLTRARNEGEEDDLRAYAAEIGLELSRVFRLPRPDGDPAPLPDAWPFAPDELCERAVVVRRLAEPLELRVDFAQPDGDDETLAPIALPLLKMALSVPTNERRAVVFFGEPMAYVVFIEDEFAAVHEYEQSVLGRVMGRFQRKAFGDDTL